MVTAASGAARRSLRDLIMLARDALETRGEIIGPHDLLIAAIALTHRLTLVTNNREFSRVPGLMTEDWTAP